MRSYLSESLWISPAVCATESMKSTHMWDSYCMLNGPHKWTIVKNWCYLSSEESTGPQEVSNASLSGNVWKHISPCPCDSVIGCDRQIGKRYEWYERDMRERDSFIIRITFLLIVCIIRGILIRHLQIFSTVFLCILVCL